MDRKKSLHDYQMEAARGAIPVSAPDMAPVQATMEQGAQAAAGIRESAFATAQSLRGARAPLSAQTQFPELAYNELSNKYFVQGADGRIHEVDPSPANLYDLARLQSEGKLSKITSPLPDGTVPIFESLQDALDEVEAESDFTGEFGAAFKTSVGLAGSAIDAMFGSDDPSNALSRASEDYANQQSVGQYKASQAPWFTPDGFLSGLGQTTGNITGSVVTAAPLIGAGIAAGGPVGGVVTGALGVSGAAGAAGDQATAAYDAAMELMQDMDERQLLEESPAYRRARAQGLDDAAAREQVAITGARAAMMPAAALGGLEGLVGGYLGRGIIGRLSRFRNVAPVAGAPATSRLGRALTSTPAQMVGAGVASGAEEVAESAFSQPAAALATGLGSTNPADYASWKEFEQASMAGFLLRGLGGRGRTSSGLDDLSDALGSNAGRQSPNDAGPVNDTPAFLRRGHMYRGPGVPAGAQGSLPLEVPFDYDADAAYAQPGVLDGPAPEPAVPLPNPAQAELPLQTPTPPAAPVDPRQQAMATFVQLTGLQTPEQIQQAMPDLLDLADQHPGFKAVMDDAGLTPTMLPPGAPPAPQAPPQQADLPLEEPAPALELRRPPGRRPRRPRAAPVDSAEPLEAPAQRTDDGRPMGVAPPPLPNPEPMHPEQARQSAQTRAQRRAAAGAPPVQEPAAPVSPEGVTPSTPEPAADIAAQIDALLDPQSERRAVFVAEGNEAQIPQDLATTAPDLLVARRRGRGTLITDDPALARKFQRGRWTDADTQRVLGYSENKTEQNAADGVVVEARTPEGAVAAQQLATNAPRNRRAAEAAVRRQARKGATVVQTTPEKAQADRVVRGRRNSPEATVPQRQLGPKAEAAVTRRKEAQEVKKKSPAAAGLVDAGAVTRSAREDDTTTTQRAAAQAKAPSEPRAAPRLDVPDAGRPDQTVTVKGEPQLVPGRLVSESGVQGEAVDLRTSAVDEALRERLREAMTKGKMAASDAAIVERALRDMDQLDVMLDAAMDAAEERLLERIDKSAEGRTLLDAVSAVRLRLELAQRKRDREAAGKDARGRRPGRPKVSPLISVPLLGEEMLHFARLLRAQAKAEVANAVEPAQSAFRLLMGQVMPGLSPALETSSKLQEAARRVAALDDEALDAMVRDVAGDLKDSLLAKMVMRGTTEVARAQGVENALKRQVRKNSPDTAQEATTERTTPDPVEPATEEELGLEAEQLAHVRAFKGDLPDAAAKTVNGWLQMLERAGVKADRVQLASMATAMRLYPEAFPTGKLGRYAQVVRGGETIHVIAVDWEAYGDNYALEVLAHEFGEYAGRAIFNRSATATQEAVMDSYITWLAATRGMSPTQAFQSHAPTLLRTLASNKMDATYARSFTEWLSNHVARFMLTEAKPRGVVEQFFAKVAGFLRSVWESLVGDNRPDAAVADMLNAWMSKRAANNAAGRYRIISTAGDMDIPLPSGHRVAEASLRRATAGAKSAKKVFGGFQRDGLSGLREELVSEGSSLFGNLMKSAVGGRLRKVGHWITNMDQLVAAYAKTPVGAALREWVRLHRRAGQLANVVLNGGKVGKHEFKGMAAAMEQAQNLSKQARTALEDVMLHATRWGIHPDQIFDDQPWLYENLSVEAITENMRRYDGLQAKWETMVNADARAAEIYADLRDAFVDLKEKEYAQLKDNVTALGLSPKVEARILKWLEDGRREITRGPYFPLLREGDWIITASLPAQSFEMTDRHAANKKVRDLRAQNPGAQVYIEDEHGEIRVWMHRRAVRFFNSEAAAEAARSEMLEALADEYKVEGVDLETVAKAIDGDASVLDTLVTKPHGKSDAYRQLNSNDTSFISEFREALKASGKMDPEISAMFEEAFIESMPELSPRKALLRRENILGADQQMLRAYTVRFFGAAHNFSNLVYKPRIREQWAKMEEVSRGRGDEAFAPAADLLNTLRKHQEMEREQHRITPNNGFQNGLLQLTSLSFLAFSPAYMLMNAMQPTMVTIPSLAGALNRKGDPIGYAKAVEYVKEAYAGAPGFFAKRGVQDFVANLKRMAGKKVNHDAHALTEAMLDKFSGGNVEERAMLTEMLELGRLDFSFLDVLQDIMQGGNALSMLSKVTRLGMSFAQQGEAMNRVVTALASYRIARKEAGMSHEQATMYAYDVVGETQIDYSTFNRPLLFKAPWVRVALQFKMFLQGMYGLLIRNTYLAVAGGTQEQRRSARKVLLALFGTHFAVAGVNGIGPVAGIAQAGVGVLAALMGRDDDDDEWKDAETIFEEQARYVFGATGGDVVRSGLPTLFKVDVSSRIEFPNLIETKYMGFRADDTGDDVLNKWAIWAAGAPAANLMRVAKGIGYATDGNPETSASIALPSGPRSVVQAWSLGSRGLVDKDGDTFLHPSELGTPELVMKALGLTPTAVQKAYQQRSAERSTISAIRSERSLLLQRARNAGDRREADSVRSEIAEFNERVPRHFRITGESIAKAKVGKAKREAGELDRDQRAVREEVLQ